MALNIKINENDILFIGSPLGKMENIFSLSTNKNNNSNCIKLSKNKKTVCNKCYVKKSMGINPHLEQALNRNEFLKTRLLEQNEIEKLSFLKNQLYFRFESFGDVDTLTQLINYNNIAKNYKNCNFALWTKNYFLLLKYFRAGYTLAKNIRLVISSPFLNADINELFINTLKKYHNDIITFSVYDKNHLENKNVNCGSKKCIDCLNCYKSGKRNNVIEILK